MVAVLFLLQVFQQFSGENTQPNTSINFGEEINSEKKYKYYNQLSHNIHPLLRLMNIILKNKLIRSL